MLFIDALLAKAKVPSLNNKWKLLLVTEVFKALNGKSPSYIQNLFQLKSSHYDLRASKLIELPKCLTTTHGINSLTYQGAKLWNGLPEHVKLSKNTSEFVNNVQKYLLDLIVLCFNSLII